LPFALIIPIQYIDSLIPVKHYIFVLGLLKRIQRKKLKHNKHIANIKKLCYNQSKRLLYNIANVYLLTLRDLLKLVGFYCTFFRNGLFNRLVVILIHNSMRKTYLFTFNAE
jgi:hypothetical protein